MRRVLVSLAMCVLCVAFACSRSDGYAQDSPAAVLRTAKLMVERGEARRLVTLVYAENDDWSKLLRAVGVTLGHLQELGKAVNDAFPKEVAQLKADAEASAKKGQAVGLVQQLTGQRSPFQRRPKNAVPNPNEQKRQQEAIAAAVKRLFADPYAFLQEGAGHMTTTPISDDVAAVLWDNQPVMSPIGLTLKRGTVNGREGWFVVLPTNLPFLANFMPRTKEEFKVAGSLVATINNMIVDLTKDVKEKKVASLEQVANKAGEKALVPAAMAIYAYGKVMEARKNPGSGTKTGPG